MEHTARLTSVGLVFHARLILHHLAQKTQRVFILSIREGSLQSCLEGEEFWDRLNTNIRLYFWDHWSIIYINR